MMQLFDEANNVLNATLKFAQTSSEIMQAASQTVAKRSLLMSDTATPKVVAKAEMQRMVMEKNQVAFLSASALLRGYFQLNQELLALNGRSWGHADNQAKPAACLANVTANPMSYYWQSWHDTVSASLSLTNTTLSVMNNSLAPYLRCTCDNAERLRNL